MRRFLTILFLVFICGNVMAQQKIQLRSDNRAECIKSDMTSLKASFSFSTIEAQDYPSDHGTFSWLNMPNTVIGGNVGTPQIPVLNELIAVPVGSTPRIEITNFNMTDYNLDDYGIHTLVPRQPSLRKDQKPGDVSFVYEEDAYQIRGLGSEPNAIVNVVGTMRGIRLGKMTIEPVSYDPVNNTLRVFNNIEVEIFFDGADTDATEKLLIDTYSPYFDIVYKQIFNGRSILDTYSEHPDLYTTPVKMLVVTTSKYTNCDAFNNWLVWKKQKGIDVDVQTVSDGASASDIRSLIQTKYNANHPTFLIIIGDKADVTSYTTYSVPTLTQNPYDSDLQYASIDDDVYHDMYMSRMSVSATSELDNLVNKILTYEQYTMASPSYLNEALLIAGWDPNKTSMYLEPTIQYANTYYFNNNHGIIPHVYISTTTGQTSCYNCINNVGFINYAGHGNIQEWTDPLYSSIQVNALDNNDKYFWAMGNCCLSANWGSNNTCLGEYLIRAANKGAFGYIGSVPETYWIEDYYFALGATEIFSTMPTMSQTTMGVYDAMFDDSGFNTLNSIPYIGNVAVTYAYVHDNYYCSSIGNYGVVDDAYYWRAYQCLGDGSVMPYVKQPEANNVSHASTILAGANFFTVYADAGSYVSITQNDEILGVAQVGSSGSVNVPITIFNAEEDVMIVVTRNQRQPYIATINGVGDCAAPTNLSATLNGRNVDLSWTAVEGVSSYRVYRNNVLIASNVTGTTYTDNDMEVGQNYYALRSNCDDGSISAMSNVVNVNVSFNGYITVVIGNLKYTLNWDTAEAEVYGPKYYTYIGDIVIPESVNYTIDDITINYTVKSIRENAFKDCYSMTGSLVIPNTVTSVGESAFDGCSGLDGSLTLSNSLITIGNRAFYGCNFTSTLAIPHSVTTIGDNAFVGCDFTGSLTIPNTVTSIGDGAFAGSGFTGSLKITNSVTSISSSAFRGCGFTGLLTIPLSVTSIGDYAFYGCDFTGSLTIPNSVTSIGGRAFKNCAFTGSLSIGNSVTSIGDYAFDGCNGFTGSLTIPNAVTSIGNSAFRDCNFNGLAIDIEVIPNSFKSQCGMGFTGPLTIGNHVTSIGNYAFSDCAFTGSLTIPNSVISIGDYAFYGCDFTGSLTIPNSVTSIGGYAFKNCAFTGSLSIGNSVTSIGDYAFDGCNGFTGSLTIPNSVTSIGKSAFRDCSFNGLAIDIGVIPNSFKSQCGAGFTGSLTIGNHVTSIGNYAFSGCTFTGSLTIPNSVTSIGDGAFGGCNGLVGPLTIGNHVASIGNSAFYNCSGFTGTLTIPNSVTTIGEEAFSGCDGLTSITIPNSVTTIGDRTFKNCIGLTSVYWNAENITSRDHFSGCSNLSEVIFGDSVLVIPEYCFYNCSSLTSVTIGDSVITIGYSAFVGCDGLTSVTIPNSVTTIGNWAFSGCSGLTSITIPNSVTTIGNRAFDNCSGLTSVSIGNSVITIGEYAFFHCTGLTSVTIGNSVTTIGEEAFSGCSGLTSVTIPNSVTTIGNGAFSGCSGLTSITIPNSVTTIGVSAFYGCVNMITVYYTGNISQWCDISYSGFPDMLEYANNLYINNELVDNLVIPETVVEVKPYAFYSYSGLTSVTFSNSVTTIGDYAFSGCSGLTSLTIPNSVTTIGVSAFSGCSGLTSITIGNSVITIGNWAFGNCGNIYTIRIEADIPPTVYPYTFYRAYNATLFVPCNKQYDYKTADYWSWFNTIVDSRYNLVITQNDALGGEISVLKYADCDDDHCAILAVPNIGYDFGGWYVNGELSTIQPFCDFSLIDDVIFEARFARREYHEVATGASTIWSNPITWDNGEVPDATSTVAIRNNVTVDIDATVEALGVYDNSVLTIQSGVTLVINDTLGSIDESSIIIEDGGQLVHSSNDALVTLNKSIDGYTSDDDGWNLISFPLVDNGSVASVGNMLSNQYDLYYYDEPAQAWINQKDDSNNFIELEVGRGYLYSNKGDGTGEAVGVRIGEEVLTTGVAPFCTYYNYSIAENIFLASELETVGLTTTAIGGLSWYATNANGKQQNNISIWMANVNDNALTSTSHNVNNMTLVYSGSMTPVMGWNIFVFNENSFTWDGLSNILICVQMNNGTGNSLVSWQAHNPGFAGQAYNYNFTSEYDMTEETYTMTVSSSKRSNIIFQTVEQSGQYEIYEPITLSFAGEIENGTAEVTVPLSYTGGNKLSGFNLVGNPFVHNVTSYETTNVADGCFRVNDARTNLIVSTISELNPLKPAEGFFVKATGDNASVTFNSSSKRGADDRGSITMEIIQNDKIIDRFVVKENGDNLNKISLRGNHTEIYAKNDGHKLALVPLKSNEQAVNFKSADIGMYTINVAVENMDLSYLHLVDNITGANIDLLRNPSYSFYASASDYESRFRLIFDPSISPGNSDVFAYQNGDDIIVNGNGVLQVYDVMGRMLATQRVTGVETVSKPSQDGVYIYRLINGNDVQTQKIVVR